MATSSSGRLSAFARQRFAYPRPPAYRAHVSLRFRYDFTRVVAALTVVLILGLAAKA